VLHRELQPLLRMNTTTPCAARPQGPLSWLLKALMPVEVLIAALYAPLTHRVLLVRRVDFILRQGTAQA